MGVEPSCRQRVRRQPVLQLPERWLDPLWQCHYLQVFRISSLGNIESYISCLDCTSYFYNDGARMKANENDVLVGSRVVLVPYFSSHVLARIYYQSYQHNADQFNRSTTNGCLTRSLGNSQRASRYLSKKSMKCKVSKPPLILSRLR